MENKIAFIKVNTLHDLLYHLKNTSNLKVFGGGTSLHKKNKETTVDINENAIFASAIAETVTSNLSPSFAKGGIVAVTITAADVPF